MDQIRPIGPVERDIDPVQRVQRTSDERERQEPRERPPQQQRKAPAPPDDEPPADGGSLIDVRV